MARTTTTITLKLRWWLRHYLTAVRLTSQLTGCEPNWERVRYWVDKGTKVVCR